MASSRLSRLLLASALLTVPAAARTEYAGDETGLSGHVLAPDGTPVSSGSVTIDSWGARSTTSIDEHGRFLIEPRGQGRHILAVSVPGLAPYRVRVEVPRSRTVKLPVIRLSPATYFRVRFVTADGDPLIGPRLRRQSFDASGSFSVPGDGVSERMEGDGTISVGPLPRGLATFALDSPPLAQTRLPNLYVTGEKELLEGGTVVVQPGAVLQVDLFDESGAPVPQHAVSLEDIRPMSPLTFEPARTNQEGRATFDRLSAGRYRVRTTAVERCGPERLAIAPVVPVPGSGTARTRLVVDGRARFRFTSPLGPLRGMRVSASPDNGSPPTPVSLRPRFDPQSRFGRPSRETSCSGATDADGRVTLADFPPGPAQVALHLLNSTYVRRVDVPQDGREIAIVVPEGFLPVRVTSADKHEPINGATITWTHDGGRIEGTTSPAGEVLLEGVGTTGGTLAFAAAGYKPAAEPLKEPPAVLYEVALVRAPTQITNLQARVLAVSGEPLPDAVVELTSEDPMEVPRVAVTDAKGVVSFPDAPPGSVRLIANADGFVPAALPVGENGRTGIVLTLARELR